MPVRRLRRGSVSTRQSMSSTGSGSQEWSAATWGPRCGTTAPSPRTSSPKYPYRSSWASWAMITGLVIALPIGIYSAIRQDTWGDYFGRTAAILMMSVPGFWIMTMVIVFPAIWWGWVPPMEYIPIGKDAAGECSSSSSFRGLSWGRVSPAALMRMVRTLMLEVLRQDYIRTAWAKGLSERVVIVRHALKNAHDTGGHHRRHGTADADRRRRGYRADLQSPGIRDATCSMPSTGGTTRSFRR